MGGHPDGRCYPRKSYPKMADNGAKRTIVEACGQGLVAEGMGFEPMSPLSQTKRLAGARTRPLCDPSLQLHVIKRP